MARFSLMRWYSGFVGGGSGGSVVFSECKLLAFGGKGGG